MNKYGHRGMKYICLDAGHICQNMLLAAEDQGLEPHIGVGVGLRVKTPLGPIRLDLGFGEEGNQAHFSFGQAF